MTNVKREDLALHSRHTKAKRFNAKVKIVMSKERLVSTWVATTNARQGSMQYVGTKHVRIPSLDMEH